MTASGAMRKLKSQGRSRGAGEDWSSISVRTAGCIWLSVAWAAFAFGVMSRHFSRSCSKLNLGALCLTPCCGLRIRYFFASLPLRGHLPAKMSHVYANLKSSVCDARLIWIEMR